MIAKDIRACPDCGGPKYRKAKRCKRCMGLAYRNKVHTDRPTPNAGRARAQKLYSLGVCQYAGCEKPARDRHHIDGDTANNESTNIVFYCRRHHMQVDGRLEKLAAQAGVAGRKGGRPRHVNRKEVSNA